MVRAIALLSVFLMGILVHEPVAQVGGCTENNSDDFATDTIGTDWIPALNDQAPCTWSITGGQLHWEVTSTSGCNGNRNRSIHRDVDLGSIEQYGCVRYVNRQNSNTADPGIAFRAASASAGTDIYQAGFRTDIATTLQWNAADGGADVGTCTLPSTPTEGDLVCARISGTGTGTVLEGWINPTGSTPDDWGASDCCMNESGSDTRGTVCNAVTRSLGDPGVATDTGNYSGIRKRTNSRSVGNFINLDDWRSGTCPS